MTDGPSAIIAETHVHADRRLNARDGALDYVEKFFGMIGTASEAGFVELDKVHSDIDQCSHLTVDNRNQRLGDLAAILVHFAALQATGESERTRHWDFNRR